MKKFILSLLFALIVIPTFTYSVNANELSNPSNNVTIVSIVENELDNGFSEEIIIKEYSIEDSSRSISKSKSGSKTVNVKDANNNTLWSLTVYGNFLYDGYTSSCTSSSISTSVNNSNWKITNAYASKTSNSALGYATGKQYTLGVVINTIEKSISLTCNKNGTLS